MSFPSLSYLVAHWKLNDNTTNSNVVDSTTNRYLGLYFQNFAQYNTNNVSVAGKINRALSYAGATSNYTRVTNKALFPWKTLNDWSVCFWIKFTSFTTGVGYSVFGQGNFGSNPRWHIEIYPQYGVGSTDFSVRFNNGVDGAKTVNTRPSMTPTTGTWYHFCVVRSAGDFYFYWDNVYYARTSADPTTWSLGNPTSSLYFGWATMDTAPTATLDDVRVYSCALSVENIRTIFNGTNGTESNGFVNSVNDVNYDSSTVKIHNVPKASISKIHGIKAS